MNIYNCVALTDIPEPAMLFLSRPWVDCFYGKEAKAYGKWSQLEQGFDNIVELKGGKAFPKVLNRKCPLERVALVS